MMNKTRPTDMREMLMWMNPFQFESFTLLSDRLASIFFQPGGGGDENDVYKMFSHLSEDQLNALPFGGMEGKPILHYGGDYFILYDKESEEYIFHFIIPGHNEDTLEVTRINNRLAIKNKDDTSGYTYYKSIPLVKEGYVVTSATIVDGILSLTIKDHGKKEVEVQHITLKGSEADASNAGTAVNNPQSENPVET
jgi:HSP20 family molecular chaperone IbpA